MSGTDVSDDETSSDDSQEALPKRPRLDTTGASSTTSYGSALLESDEDVPEGQTYQIPAAPVRTRSVNYTEGGDSTRLSRSSLSENCSSPTENEDFKPSFSEQESDWQETARSSFGSGSYYEPGDEAASTLKQSVAARMMSNMGYKEGRGLGKNEHGRTEPVKASSQKGRRGLGAHASTLGKLPADFKWTPDDTKAEAKEEVIWMPDAPNEPLNLEQLEDWMKTGAKKLTIDDEDEFCDPVVVKGVLNAKNIFDELDGEDLRKARFRSNPYETIGSVLFLNRAAVKMANMDAVFGFMFTRPKTKSGESLERGGLLYFADVCAGPGGFSEYVLYKRGWKAKGFGFTLKGSNDFKLSDFYAGTPESFTAYYGVEDNGDIFNPANLTSLKNYVLSQTNDQGVHFLMADGGFSVDGQENIQEILSKQLYLCQCLAALMLVRTEGHFVVKLFDLFTPFSIGLVYIMYRCFEKVCIHKPVTSRPANSERYLVCKWKRPDTEACESHLYSVNETLWRAKDGDIDVTQLVPLDVLKEDKEFYDYIYNSNCFLGEKQIRNLLKIAQYCKDPSLKDNTQAEMRKQCLELWQIPDEVRIQPPRLSPDEALSKVISLMQKTPKDAQNIQTFKSNVLGKPAQVIESAADLKRFRNIYNWHFQFLSTSKVTDCKFFLGCGGSQVYQLDGTRWNNVTSPRFIVPAKTLIYGEILREYQGEGGHQKHLRAFHIIDAVCLGGRDISSIPLPARLKQCELFCASLEKPLDNTIMPIRCKRLFDMENFTDAMERLDFRQMKTGAHAVTLRIPIKNGSEELYNLVGSLLFMKAIKEPWESTLSRSSGVKYYYKPHGESEYRIVEEACMDPINSIASRVIWVWDPASSVFSGRKDHKGLRREEMEAHVSTKTVVVTKPKMSL